MFPCILIKEISIFRNKVLKGNFVVSFKNFYEYNIEVQIFYHCRKNTGASMKIEMPFKKDLNPFFSKSLFGIP